MPQNAVTLSAGFNESQLSDSLARAIKIGLGKGFAGAGGTGGGLNSQAFTGPLGRMTAGVKDFDTVLASANKRVIGFGVSVGLLGGSVRTFQGLISATREVESSLAKIGSVMALTSRQTDQLSKSLFNLARQTGTSFEDASSSVEEFAKQGGTLVQTLERAKVALALSKVGNIDAKEAVDGLTSAYAQFGKMGENYLSIANKISAATRNSVVSVKDITDGIGQFGAEALDAGLNLKQLIALVADLKQKTGDAGPRSLNRLFSNVSNPASAKKLNSIGIDTTDINGQAKSSLALLTEITKAYGTLSQAQKNVLSQAIGGTYQSNVLKSLVDDLNGVNSTYAKTLAAIDKGTNDLQNRLIYQTNNLDQALKNLKTSATQVGSTVGELTLKPAISNIVGAGNLASNLFGNLKSDGSTKPAEDFGAYLGESILKGIGSVLSGPGLVILGRVFAGAVSRTFPEVISDVKQTAGFGNSKKQDLQVLNGINKALSLGTSEEQAQYRAALDVTRQHEILLGIMERQLQVAEATAAANFAAVEGAGTGALRRQLGTFGRNAAGGYLPSAIRAESAAIMGGVGGAPSSARPIVIPNFAYGGGVTGPIVGNSSEFVVGGAGGSSIYNRDMIRRYGLPPGSTPVAAGGHVPNMAFGGNPPLQSSLDLAYLKTDRPPKTAYDVAFERSNATLTQRTEEINQAISKLADTFQEGVLRQRRINDQIKNIGAHIAAGAANPDTEPDSLGNLNNPEQVDPIRRAIRTAQNRYRGSASIRIPKQYSNPTFSGPEAGEPSFIGPIAPDTGERAFFEDQRQKAESDARNSAALARHERVTRGIGAANNALLYGSFATGFIPSEYTQGGTVTGQRVGALTGAVQGGAIGGQIGSIVGPEGTAAGIAIGALLGAVIGFASKATRSFQELSQSINETNAHNQQKVSSLQSYLQGVDRLREAQSNGTDQEGLQRIDHDNKQSFIDLDPDIKKSLNGARTDKERVSILSTLVDKADTQRRQGDVLASISQFVKAPNTVDPVTGQNQILETAAENIANLFGNTHVDDKTLATLSRSTYGGKNFKSSKDAAVSDNSLNKLIRSSNLDDGVKKEALAQLAGSIFSHTPSGLGGIQPLRQRVAALIGINQSQESIESRPISPVINLKAIQDSIQDDVEATQDRIGNETGASSFLRRSTAQRVGAVSRILSSSGGKVRFGGRTVGGGDLEGQLQIQSAQQEGVLSNRTSLDQAKAGFLKAIDTSQLGSVLNQNGQVGIDKIQGLQASINGAQSPEALKALLKSGGFDPGETKSLERLLTEAQKTATQSEREVQLVKDSIDLQRQELEVSKQSQLLLRGNFSLKSANEFSSLRAGSATLGIGRFGAGARINSSIQQSELLDELGLPKAADGSTEAYQQRLRERSTRIQLATLTGRALGRRVGTDSLSLTRAASQLSLSGNPDDRQLGSRTAGAVGLFGVDAHAISQRILTGKGGEDDLSKGVALGKITPGESGIISVLEDIRTNTNSTATNTPNRGGTQPAQGSTAPASKNSFGSDGSLLPGAVLPPFVVTASRGGGGGSGKGGSSDGSTSSGSVTPGFKSGFAETLSALPDNLSNLYQIGAATANNLNSAFGKFFGDFATGALKGQQAFRGFVSSIFADESRLFADSATTDLFKGLGNVLEPHARGGMVGYAKGGSVPVMLTGGEYVFTPQQARRLGPQALHALNGGSIHGYADGGGVVKGGSGMRDDVPGRLPAGSFVIKRSAVQKAGVGTLNSLARGNYATRDSGGGIFGLGTGVGGSLVAGGIGSIAGALIGALLDKNNRGQGALVGAGLGFGLGFGANALGAFGSGSPVSNAASSFADPNDSGLAGSSSGAGAGGSGAINGAGKDISFGGAGVKIGAALGLGEITQLLNPKSPTLDYAGVQRNAVQLEGNQQSDINARPAGSFESVIKNRNGTYTLLDQSTTAAENLYGNNGRNASAFGYADGGSVGGDSVGYMPSSLAPSSPPVQANVTIHNYANGSSQSTSSTSNGDPNNPLGSPEFAQRVNKYINVAIQEQLVQASRNGGANSVNRRYNPNG